MAVPVAPVKKDNSDENMMMMLTGMNVAGQLMGGGKKGSAPAGSNPRDRYMNASAGG